MIQSFVLVKNEIPNAVFYIMGSYDEEPEYYEECLSLVRALGVEDIIFTGTVPVLDYIGKMDVLVLTSISEGQPLAILEGMAAGKPYVTTNVGSCKELMDGLNDDIGPAGFVVPVMHTEHIAAAIINLAKHKSLRKEFGRHALQRVKTYYQSKNVIQAYRKVYEKLGVEINGRDRIRTEETIS